MPPPRTAAAPRPASRRFRAAACFGLAAYLTVFVTAPAWHTHEGHDHAAHGGEAEAKEACDGHAHHGHDHAEETPAAPAGSHGDHDCPVCELIGTPVAPAAPPAVVALSEAPPSLIPPAAPDRRAAFLRTTHARGPPRA